MFNANGRFQPSYRSMDCTITSITRKGNKAHCAGMTLVELLMAIGISGMVFAAVSILIFFSGRSYAALTNYVDLDNRSRGALDRMSKEIRQVDCVTNSATTSLPSGQVVTNRLVLSGTEPDGSAYTLTYDYNPATETLIRTKPTNSAGSILLMTLLTAWVIGIALVSYLTLVANQNRSTYLSLSWNSCIPVMEAGVEEALTHIYHNDTTQLGNNQWTYSDGLYHKTNYLGDDGSKYHVTIQPIDPPLIVSTGYYPAPGNTGAPC